ncbi:hypothetical protein B0O80DRAFT_499549 [Mortierella sp. GBAus27b]|nr:hypothetical protein B0O80DRAFT_499549 [Mortierella sp. GBAus27b]
MFDIPELDDLVCRQLSQHNLTQCARVNKKWHAIVVPYIWRSLHCLRWRTPQAELFRRMVLKDFVEACASKKDGHPMDRHIRLRPRHISTLSQYAPLIRELPRLEVLFLILRDLTVGATGQSKGPTEHQLATHLFTRCLPDVEFTSMNVIVRIISDDARKAASAFALPRAHHVRLYVSTKDNRTEYSRAKGLLSQCSTRLKKLDICISTAEFGGKDIDDGSLDSDQQVRWTSLREVGLELATYTPNTEEFLNWLWKQCGQVERLKVSTDVHAVQNIVRGMLSHMPQLSEITLEGANNAFDDDKFAALLSGSRTGWRRAEFLDGLDVSDASVRALVNHSATLEEFTLDGCFVRDTDLVQVFRHCNRLQRMIIANTYHTGDDGTSRIGANAFVDQDPDTGELITWACEGSLRSLEVTIVDIPRPDLRRNSLFEETYPGQGRDIHNQVYSRLARLTNLETLRLGDQEDYETQLDCLGMSLESGLHKLSGLKSLKELGIPGMRTRIGVGEVRWMVEQWPRLRDIRGIGNDKAGKRAKKWMQENRPLISV